MTNETERNQTQGTEQEVRNARPLRYFTGGLAVGSIPVVMAAFALSYGDPLKGVNPTWDSESLLLSSDKGVHLAGAASDASSLRVNVSYDETNGFAQEVPAGIAALARGHKVELNGATLHLSKVETAPFYPAPVKSDIVCLEAGACTETRATSLFGIPFKSESKASDELTGQMKTLRETLTQSAKTMVETAQGHFNSAFDQYDRLTPAAWNGLIRSRLALVKPQDLYTYDDVDAASGFLRTDDHDWSYEGGNDRIGTASFKREQDSTITHEQGLKDGSSIKVTTNTSGLVRIEQARFDEGAVLRVFHMFDDETQQVKAWVNVEAYSADILGLKRTKRYDLAKPLYRPEDMMNVYGYMNEVATRLETQLLMGRDIPQDPKPQTKEQPQSLIDDQGTFGFKALSALKRLMPRCG